jgi:peptide/nickel transport system substrate-binding protein
MRKLWVISVALLSGCVLAACGGGGSSNNAAETTNGGSSANKGGTYKVGWEQAFSFTDNFDPTGEYLGDAITIYSNLLVRTLVGYNHVAGLAGNKLVPDIATSVPQPTNGGKTYTFTLKKGIRFGPPVNRAVTSKDILYSFERMAKPKNGAQYGFYYDVIKGFTDYGAGKAKTISGIETPSANKIIFNLTVPTGDFLYRVSMPATGPIPQEVAKCFEGRPGAYGKDLVSSGPYMIAGAQSVKISSCSALKPMSGFDGQTHLQLVRNPNYDPASDSTAARQNLPDTFEWLVNTNAIDILDQVASGTLQDEISTIPVQVLRSYATDPSKKASLHLNSGDRTWYITMNLTQPPFDDIHVRKAMNWVMDKHALIQAWGGPTVGKAAHHIVPDTLFDNQLAEYDPYATPEDQGDVAKAKQALQGSKYGNGMCTASACKNVYLLADARVVDTKMLPVIESDAKKIGITFAVHTIKGAYPTLQTPSRNIPISERPGWGKDFADPLTFFTPLFNGRTIIPNGNTNYSLVGITPSQCVKLHIKGNCRNVPSVDSQIDKCAELIGQSRLTCYENLDKTMMTDVVPWVPYLWSFAQHVTSQNVTKWEFDQFGGSTAYAHVAVK